MSHQYSTALSHIVLAGTGIWCLKCYGLGDFRFPHGTFGLIITHSLIGIWRWGNPDHGDKVDRPYQFTYFLQTIFAFPCIATEIWLMYRYQRELCYAHVGISFIPLLQYLLNRHRGDIVDLVIAINTISLGVVSFMEANYFGVATAVSFAINHFCIRDESEILDMPSKDLYNYGMCFFSYFALRALSD